MSRKYKFNDQTKLYFISFAVVYWIDVFIRNEYKDILLDSFKFCKAHKGLEVYAYCIMTSHVHMIIGSHQEKLENIVRDLKSFTSRKLKEAIKENPIESRREWMLWMMERAGRKNSNNKEFQFWQQHNHPIELFNNDIMLQKLNYIHNNPVEAGFVNLPENYVYSSAKNYCGIKGIFNVLFIE